MNRLFIPLIILFASTGCFSLRTAELNSFKIGLVAPTSGRYSSEGYRMVCAAKKAIHEWNSGDRLKGGYYAELVTYDETADADQPEMLLLDPQVIGVVGYSRASKAAEAMKLFGPARMPLIVAGVRDPPANPAGGGVFWMAPDNSKLSEATVRFIKEHLGSRTASVVAGPDLADLSQAEMLRQKIEADGISLVRSEAALPYSSDYSGLASRLLQSPSDVVVIAGDPLSSGEFWASYRGGSKSKVASTILTPDFVSVAKDQAADTYYPSPMPTLEHSGAASNFKSEFTAGCKDIPTPLSALVYDSVNLMLRSIGMTLDDGLPLEREGLAKRISSAGEYTGVTGPVSFDRSGQRPVTSIYFYKLAGDYPGHLATSYTIEGD